MDGRKGCRQGREWDRGRGVQGERGTGESMGTGREGVDRGRGGHGRVWGQGERVWTGGEIVDRGRVLWAGVDTEDGVNFDVLA